MTRTLHTYATLTRTPEQAAEALTAGCLPCELAAIDDATTQLDTLGSGSLIGWSGPLVFEDQMTGDGRYIEPGALRTDTFPLPFRFVFEDSGRHDGAVVVGRILSVERRDGGVMWGTGDIDISTEDGMKAARLIDTEQQNGVSVDLDDVSFEIRVAKELLRSPDEMMEEAATETVDADGRVTVVAMGSDDEVMATTDARIRAATGVSIPAFEGARITLDTPLPETLPLVAAGQDPALFDVRPDLTLVAGGYPIAPPQEWFSNPNLTEPTPLTITAEGRVFGHLAVFGTCHTAYTGQCVTPPHAADYSDFITGSLLTAEGSTVPVGQITMDTLHAGDRLSAAAAKAHYENTGAAAADITVGEDAVGIWFTGALRPSMTAERVRALRASPLSGDWRDRGTGMRMVAALSVNVQGFPVPRPKGLVAGGKMVSLVASGMLAPNPNPGDLNVLGFSPDDVGYLRRLAARERQADLAATAEVLDEAATLAMRVTAMQLARRVQAATR